MLNNILLTRTLRHLRGDKDVPKKCFSKWWYNDVFEKCDCKEKCKYTNFTHDDWIRHVNLYFKDLKL